MRSRRSCCIASKVLVLGFLLSCSGVVLAQDHGNHAPRTILTRPDAVDDKDTLKDFHRALAVQATTAQIEEFQAWLKTTDSARVQLQPLLQNPQHAGSTSGLDQVLETARTQTRNFLDGFSDKQKIGLKEQIRLLDRADTELAEQQNKFDQASQISSSPPAEFAANASSLDKALDDFSSQQLAMAREMGIVLANAQDVTFNLPAIKSNVTFASQPLQFTVSGILSQTGADAAGKRTFRLEIMNDLTDFQQNITEVMRAAVDNENACGERLSVRRAVLMPSVPGGSLNLQLHYERWACLRIAGQSTSTELAENDGEVEVHLLPAISQDGLQLKADFGRIDAVGMMADSLRNGQLGSDLRDIVVHAFLTAMRTTSDFKTDLPPALQGSKLETAQFEDDGAGDLTLMLQGQAELSEEQTKSLASQLNQTLAAEDNGTK
jgi:hypothetical protein